MGVSGRPLYAPTHEFVRGSHCHVTGIFQQALHLNFPHTSPELGQDREDLCQPLSRDLQDTSGNLFLGVSDSVSLRAQLHAGGSSSHNLIADGHQAWIVVQGIDKSTLRVVFASEAQLQLQW